MYDDFKLADESDFLNMQVKFAEKEKMTPERFGQAFILNEPDINIGSFLLPVFGGLRRVRRNLNYFRRFVSRGELLNRIHNHTERIERFTDGFGSFFTSLTGREFCAPPEPRFNRPGSFCLALRAALHEEIELLGELFKAYSAETRPQERERIEKMFLDVLELAKDLTGMVCAFRPRLL